MDDDVPTGEWEPGMRLLCKPLPDDECDCGFVGKWEHRWWYEWYADPTGRKRPDWLIRRDLNEGKPTRANEPGWWVIGGYDERCLGCGDIERFDMEANHLNRWHGDDARVVSLMARRRQDGNT